MKDARQQQNKAAKATKKTEHESIVKKKMKGSKTAPLQIAQDQNDFVAASVTSCSNAPAVSGFCSRYQGCCCLT